MQAANLAEFKANYDEFLQDKKKIKAISNMTQVRGISMHKKQMLDTLITCTKVKFLHEQERNFLGYLLNDLNIDYLDWCYKTPWLKKIIREMKQAARAKRAARQLYFDLDRKRDTKTVEVPLYLLKKNGRTTHATA